MRLIAQSTVTTNTDLGPCRSFKVQSLSGSVRARFDGEEIALASGDTFELPIGLAWRNVQVLAANGATAVILFGMVSFGSSGASVSGGGGFVVEPTAAAYEGAGDPEGVQAGYPGSTYYNSTAGTFWVKSTGISTTGWVQIAP